MAPVRSLLGGRFSTAMRGVLALLCLVPQGGLALAAAPPGYAPQGLPAEDRALVACTPTGSFTNCTRFTYSGGDQTFTVPAGVTSVYARLWGGGGAGSPSAYYTQQYGGGGGGYTTGTIAVTPGQKLTITSGQGGAMNSTATMYGGGGAGGLGGFQNLGTGGAGGGMSAVWNGAYGTGPLLIAGGGGGSSPGGDTLVPAGGGGGGTNGGQDNQPTISGRGGTQSAGGAAATQTACGTATAGSQYQGGRGASASTYEGGGGGGGGYYGGGGGACQRSGGFEANGMGGGGSGYIRGAGVGNAQTTAGANSGANSQGGPAAGRSDALYRSGIGNGGGNSSGGNGEVTLEWVTQVGLSITKTVSPTTYVPGQTLTYTVTVRNSGPAPANGAAVRDALPSALSGFTWTCAAGSANSACGDASGTGNLDTTATIGVNDFVTYTITGTVPSSTTGTLSNTATVTRPSATTDPNCGPTCSSTVDTPGQVTTGLSVTKTPDKSPYVPGQPLTYTIVVKNAGPSDATGVSVKDTLPATIQNFTWSCSPSGGSRCGSTPSGTGNINTTVDIPAGGQVTYTLTGTVPSDANGSLDNRATVTPPGGATDPNCSPNCTSTTNPIPPDHQANLVVSKTLLTNPVVPGQQIEWQVKVVNSGPSTARNVVVTDRIPAGVTGARMVNDQDSSACSISNGTATCPGVTIAVNAGASWTLTGSLDPNATTTPTNTAVVTGGPDPKASSHTAVASPTGTPTPQAGLTISKTLLTNPVVPGQQIQWAVTVFNAGPSRARNVVVTDTVPAGVTNAGMTARDGTVCPIANGVATCPAVEIPAGQNTTWTLTGTLDPDATTTPTNTAVVTGGPDPSATARTAVASPTSSPTPQANLTVSKSLLTNPVVPGAPIEWRVTVTNNGPSRARNVVVTDTVPDGVSGASMKADADGALCAVSGGTATCPAVEIPAGSSVSWTLNGRLDPNATVTPTNTVTVTGGPDPSASTRTAVASPTATPTPEAGLEVSKSLVTNPVVPGRQIQWRINVFNAGPSRARNVVVTDRIPAGVDNPTMTAQDGTPCPISGGVATCPAVEIPAGQALNWTLTGTLASDATATPVNTVTVTGGPDPTASTHTAVASPSNSPAPQASLTVSKVLVTSPVVPGQQVQWQVSVTNNGPSRARNVVVSDQVPSGVNGASMTASDGTDCPISGGVATCPAVEIPAGRTLTWTLTGTLDPNATVTPTNTVTVTGGPDPSASSRTAVASPTSSPSPQANLTVSKVLLTDPVVPGRQIQWRVSVTNNGPSRARNVVVSDQVPSGVNDVSMRADADGADCPISGGVATCPAVEIPAGRTLTWTLTGTLASDATATPANTVTVTGGPDPAASTHTAVASPSNSPAPQAILTVSKVLVTNPVVPGQQVQWQVSVTNNGPSRARNVVVSDQVPSGVSGASMTASDGTDCPISGGVATCPAVEIPAGQTMTWTLSGTLDPNATTTPTNTVTVTGGPDPSASSRTAVASPTATPTPQAGLSISKTLLTSPVVPGQQIQWRVSVTNNGPSRARNVVVTDQVPANVDGAAMTADADGAACPITGGTATCPAVEIPAGQTLTWTLTGTLWADATTTPTNTAVVTGGPDPSATARTAVASPTSSPTPQADLVVSKALLTDPVIPGRQIQWRVTVANNGPSRARNVVVTDTVPAGVNDPSMTASGGTSCPITGGTATCPAVEIPAGSSATWTLTGTLDPNATVTPTNSVTVTGGPDPSASSRTAVASPTSSPSPQADLTVSKVLLTDPVVPGQQVQWRVSVTNNGPSRARNVVVTDQVPAGVGGASMKADADAADCPISNGTATCPAVEIPAGQTLTWTLTGTLDANATTTPTNTAVVTGGPDPTATAHTAVASPTSSPTPRANLTVSKALLTNPVVPGQQIQWQVAVTNNGPSRARNVVVTDQVPAGVSNASMTASDGTSCPIGNGVATCPAVEIPAGRTLTWMLSGTLDANATATPGNTVTVTGGPDPTASTHTAVASPSNSPSPQANLTVSKVLITNPVVPGHEIQWRVSVTNNGPSRARNVVVSDQVPSGVNDVSMRADADGADCPVSGGAATCPAAEIPAGQTLTWTLTGTLASDATATPVNTVTVTGGPDPMASTHTAVASPSNSPSPQANLTVSKVLVTNPVVPGKQIQWQVSVTNNGPSRARNVVVADQVPAGVSGASMKSDADGATCPVNGGVATCPAVEIPAGQTLTWTLSGVLSSTATETPVNTVTVTGGPDPTASTHTAVASPSNSPSPQANLTISKVLLTDPVVAGQAISWRVVVTNNGPSQARNVVVTDQLPDTLRNAEMSADDTGEACVVSGTTATCPATTIEQNASKAYTVSGVLSNAATEVPANTAVVTGGPDPTATAHTAVASPTVPINFHADLTTSKVLLTNPVVPGQQIQWRVSVTNNGPSRARNVVVVDHIPADTSNVTMASDTDGTACPAAGKDLVCPAVELGLNETRSWTVTGTLSPDAVDTPVNTATVSGGDPSASPREVTATATVPLIEKSDVTISKVLLTNPVVPGEQIQWRISLTNNGPSTARNLDLTDRVPDGVSGATMASDTSGTPCRITNGVAECFPFDLAVGATKTFTLSGKLAQDATVTPTNTAVLVNPDDPAGQPRTAVASPTSSPTPQADLSISKTLLTSPVVPGQQVQWRVTVVNNGPSRARNVVVTDRIPAGLSDAHMFADAGHVDCPISGGVATCPAQELAVNESETFTVQGVLDPNATSVPTNTAVVTGGPDPSATARTAVASASELPTPQANLVVSKTLVTSPVVPGQQVQWRVSVTNNGPSRARNVVVSDQVPAGVTDASMRAADGTACPIANGTATCPAVEIPAGQTLTWTLAGTLDSDATVTPTNAVTVTGGPDPSASTRTAVATPSNSPSPQANLVVAKVLLTDPVVPGQQVQWRVSVTNNGPSRARNVVVSDQVPSGVNGASMKADADGTDCPVSGGVATCPAVEIPAGQTLTWTLTGTLAQDAAATPTNTVTVTGGPDPTASTHTAVASPSNSPSPKANLSVSKVLLTNPVVPGQQIQWRVSVTNNGPSRARDVVVTDRVPDGVSGPSMTAADGSVCPITNGTAVCPAIELEVGQTQSYTLSGTLMQDATVTPTNTAVVTGGPDPTATAHTAVASPSDSPSPKANLSVSKVLLTNPVIPGEKIQWRVSVTNNGPSRARNVVVTDRIPDGVNNAVLQSDADASTCPVTGGTATCAGIELEVGQTASYTLTGTLAPDATVTPTNTAVVTGGPDPTATAHTAVATPSNSPSPQANLSIAKALLTNPVVPGQQIQWRVTVTNRGPSLARNVVVTDTIPAMVNGPGMASDADGSACPIANRTATCPAVEIPAGGTVSYTVTGTLDPAATSTPVNVAVVTGGPDPTATAHTATARASETVAPQARLTVSKVLVTDPVVPGQPIAWRIAVTNNGPSQARNVVVADRIPDGVVGASLAPDATGAACPVSGGVATCPAVEIPVGRTVTYTLAGTLAQDATTVPGNTATVTGGPDPSASTHTAVASPTGTPSPQARLTLAKVLVTDPVVPGRTIEWRVTVTNDGPSRARNVVVTDRVPDGVSGAMMASDENGTKCPVGNGVATCPAIELEVGQAASYTLSGTLDPNATVTPTNTATVTGGPDPSASSRTAAASPSNSPSPQANLVVAKVLVTNPVVPGQQIQWRVSVTNNGPSRARNVVVTDRVPVGVSGASMAAADGTVCPISAGVATCPAVEIPAGSSMSWTLTGTLDADATVTPTNTVTVTGGPDPTASEHTVTASPSGSPEPQARLSVIKVLLTDPVVPGQRIQWRVSVSNDGPSRARDVVVTDRIPDGVQNASMTFQDGTSCPIVNGTATCPAVEVPVGGLVTWTLTGTLDASATVTPGNTAVVTGGPDPVTPTHTAVASPAVGPVPEARLTVSKVLLTDPVVPGQQVQWRVAVTNRGPSVARDVVVRDRVPAGVTDASMTADDGTACAVANGTATCPAVGIAVDGTRTWTLTGTLDAGATVTPTNTVTVTGGPDPGTPTHTAVASPTAPPSPRAGLSVAKVLVTDPVVAGAPIEWRVTVTNNGPSLARGVVVRDRVPADVTGAAMTGPGGADCPISAGVATCPAVEIPVGVTLTWTLTGTLDPAATATPGNTAVVTGGPDPTTPTHTAAASPSGSPAARARLTVAKVLLTSPVVAGQQIQWRVTVTNDGPSLARNVVVTDRVPAGVNGASMAADADGTPCPVTDGVATCPAVDVPVGGTLSWTLTGTLDPNAQAVPVNTVVVTGGPDPVTPTHTAVATPTEPITVRHDLLLAKHANPANPKVGDTVTYTVTATNRAAGTYVGAVVTDDLSGVLDGAGYDGNAHAGSGRTAYSAPRLTWTLDIRPGATETLTYTVTVKAGAGGATLVNRLSADGSNCAGGNGSSGGNGARRAAGGNCSTSTTVQVMPSPSPTTKPPLPPTGSGSPKPALLLTVLLLVLGGSLIAARRSRR